MYTKKNQRNDVFECLHAHESQMKTQNKRRRQRLYRLSTVERFSIGALLCLGGLSHIVLREVLGQARSAELTALCAAVMFGIWMFRKIGFTAALLGAKKSRSTEDPQHLEGDALVALKEVCHLGANLSTCSHSDLEEAARIAAFSLDQLKIHRATATLAFGFVGLFAFRGEVLMALSSRNPAGDPTLSFIAALDPFPLFLLVLAIPLLSLAISVRCSLWNKRKHAIDHAIKLKDHTIDLF